MQKEGGDMIIHWRSFFAGVFAVLFFLSPQRALENIASTWVVTYRNLGQTFSEPISIQPEFVQPLGYDDGEEKEDKRVSRR
jgi:hypothetical protein